MFEDLTFTEPLTRNVPIAMCSMVPVPAQTKSSAKDMVGVPLNQKVLTWKWYIQSRDVTTKGQSSFLMEELHHAEIGLLAFVLREEHIHAPIGKWGPSWSLILHNS